MEHELEKLLGGFAADQLTAEEKQRLYSAALQDQQLFNALADEQALKELLADPAVRRRLLQALKQKGTSGAGGPLSWLEWLRRPAGLAFAGGLAAAIFAVVLGTKIYQDSLKQTAQSVATEEAKPAAPLLQAPSVPQPTTPPFTEAPAKVHDTIEPAVVPLSKDALLDKKGARENLPAISPPRQQEAPDTARDRKFRPAEQDAAPMPTDAPVSAIGKTSEKPAASTTQKTTAAPPATSAPISSSQQVPDAGAITRSVRPIISARSLFYGESGRSYLQEAERPMTPLAQSTSPDRRLERKREQFAAAREQTSGLIRHVRPLGLRYSLVVRGPDGRERAVADASAVTQTEPVRLTFETNQDCYIQILIAVATIPPRLLFPEQDSGQISSKMVAGQRRNIPLPEKTGTISIRLARTPFESIIGQETATPSKPSPHPLQETTTAGGTSGSQEQATYVVNQDPSLAQLSVRIPVGTP